MMTRPGPFGGQLASGGRDRWNVCSDVGAFRSNIDVAGTGVHATIGEIAAAERINPSYASRVLRLTLLAPEIIEVILDGWQGLQVTLDRLLRPFPVEPGGNGKHLVRYEILGHCAPLLSERSRRPRR